jgi:peptide/nickel transport system substrate-binding protein
MRKIITSLIALVVVLSMFVGCAPNTGVTTATDVTTPTPVRTDLNYAIGAGISSLDPHFAVSSNDNAFLAQIYETLLAPKYTENSDGTLTKEYTPLLAESYEVSEDGLVYTFVIRKGIKFHDGTELKASDVEFSYLRAMQSPMKAFYTSGISNVVATDDYTVDIVLAMPFAPILESITYVDVMNEAFVTEMGEKINEETNGTGPYMFTDYVVEQRYVLTAFEEYHRGAATTKTITAKVIPDPSTVLLAFEAGELDYIGVPSSDWEEVYQSGKYTTYSYPVAAFYVTIYNLEREPFNNLKVRQAINYAIDKESITYIATEGTGLIADGMAPVGLVFGAVTPDNPYSHDPEKAKQLLTEAGYPDGLRIGNLLSLGGAFEVIAQVVQQNLADVGITTQIEMVEMNTANAAIINGDYDIAIFGASLPADYHYWGLLLKSEYVNALNPARYSNPRVDELFNIGAEALNSEERISVYKEIANIINDEAVYAPLTFGTALVATHPSLKLDIPIEAAKFYDFYWVE